jgi:PAS domain S-box-containing protein
MQQPSLTILIVDDSPEDRELYRRYLQRNQDYSYTILEASLGQQGLELWQQQRPDLVLLDYRLPDLDGLEFLAQLQSPTPQPCLPVVVMTGQGNETIAVQAMKAGAQDYLIKGQITPEGLHLAVSGAIETIQIRTELQQRIERERVVGQITQQIHQSLDLDRILQTTVTEVRQFLNTDRVLVFQLQPDGNGTVVAESVGSTWRSLLSSTIYDPCLAENYLRFSRPGSITYDSEFVEDYVKRYRQGQVTAIPDIHASDIDPCHVELLTQFQVNANLVVPILHDNLFWGLLIAHHCAAPRLWPPLEIDLLKELATHLGIALRQAELYQQSQIDLAERNRIEAELRESEERLRSALTASRMGTWDWNIQTGHIQWSDNLEEMFGLESGAFDGSFEMFALLLHPDDRDRILAAVERAIATGEDYEVEFRVVYPNGRIRWALSQGKVFYDAHRQPVRMVGNDIDITARKQAEANLVTANNILQAVINGTDDVVFVKDLQGRYVLANQAAAQWLNRTVEDMLGQDDSALFPADAAQRIQAMDQRVMQSAESIVYDEPLLRDGKERSLLSRKYPWRNEHGEIVGMIGISSDITKRKRSEQALRESEERFRTSVENMLDCFAIYQAIRNEQGEIVDFRTEYVNDAACLNNQMTREQQIGRGLCELLPGHRDSGLFDEYCQVVETGLALVKESLVYEDDYGQEHLIRAFDIRVAKFGDGYIATWRDITERKQIEEALRKNEQLLQLALTGAQAGSWDWEITTGKVTWSPENYALYGVNPATTAPGYEAWYNALHPDDREPMNTEVMQVVEQRLPEFRVEFRIIHPQLGLRWIFNLGQLTLDDQGNPLRMSGITLDITDRKQTEEMLRRTAERDAFRVSLTDDLRALDDPAEIQATASRILAEYLGANRVVYFQIRGTDYFVERDYVNGAEPLWGEFPIDLFGFRLIAAYRAGQSVSVSDVAADPNLSPDQRSAYAAIQIAAHIGIPLVKNGEFVAGLAIHSITPRAWTPEEVSLAEEVAERTWAAVERARAETALRASHDTFRHLVENSPFGVYVIDADFRIAQVSSGAQKAFENVRPVIGRDFAEVLRTLWPEPFASEVIAHFRHTLATGEPYHAPSTVERRQDTDEVESYDWKIERITLPDGRLGVVCHFYDLSERLHYEAALRESEERFRNLADHMSQLAWMTDEHGWIVWYNRRWFEYTGTTLEEMQGWGWQAVHHPDHVDRVVQRIRHCFATGEVWEDTFPLRGQDGQYRWFLSRAIPIRDQESGRILRWFGTNTDITERQQAEQERQQLLEQEQAARAEAERANRIKDEFLAILSHELRSPLNPILGWAKLLQTRQFDSTKTAEALATIERNAKLQTQLIDDLLDVAKILRGKLSMNVAPVDLVFVIEAALDTVRPAAVAKDIFLHPVLTQIGRVSGDAARLQQIIWNLLSNAIKFTPVGGRVEIRLERDGNQAKITVCDSGKGINPDFLPHIFESFRQEDASTTRQYGGLGLGLAIVRHLVEAHGGTICADSPGEGQGATFIVQLPLLDAESKQTPSEAVSSDELDLTGIRILAIDDELDARELLTALLTQYGAEVLTVTCATEVLTNLESFQPDVLISDIGMPEVDGYMLMQQIRALPREKGGQILAIALTAYARVEDYQQAIASGYQRHFTKPLDPDRLVKVIVELTENEKFQGR